MGRGRGRGRGKRVLSRDFRQPRDDQWREKRQRTESGGWAEPELNNEFFEEYYKGQAICPPEEWEAFLEALRKPLPTTFRINGSGKFADDLRDKLESDFFSKFHAAPIRIDGDIVEAPKPLPWYPHKLAWQFNFSRSQLRKLPVLEALHEFIKRENEVGAITRQEAVSMVPPLFLDVHPGHRVLDMCAAPGSKTFQLLEALHAGPEPPTGLVIANDADAQRCNLLTHQTKRMCSPALLVTNHEAQNFPLIKNLGAGPGEDPTLLFDRILCDVPCSGDGTMRKAPDIWRRWGVGNGNGLHSLQLRITLRACELLKVGGRLVYSTCTFNPIEDEAVVADVLRRTKGAFVLVDVSDHLPELKRLPGLQRWRVRDRNGWYDNWEQGKEGIKLDPTMFPDEASDAFPLDRCMRFLPHHQDTGGFFVAVLEKVGPLEKVEYPTMDHRNTRSKEKRGKQQQQQGGDKAGGSEATPATEAPAEGDGGAEGGDVAMAGAENGEGEGAPIKAAAADEEAGGPAEPPVEDAGKAVAATEGMDAVDGGDAGGEAAATAGEGEGAEQPVGEAAEGEEQKEGGGRSGGGKEPAAAPVWGGIRGGGARLRGQGGKWRGVDPIVPFLDPHHLGQIKQFYGLAEDCPVLGALISRSEEAKPKKLSYISESVKDLLRVDTRELLKVTSAGIKVLERQEDKEGLLACSYRIAQEGLPSLLPFITRQRFQPTVAEFLDILNDRIVRLPQAAKVHITKAQQAQQQQGASATPAEGDAAAAATAAAAEGGQEQQPATVAAAEGAQQEQQGGTDGGESKVQEPPKGPEASKGFMAQAKVELADPKTLEQLEAVSYGCCVATLRDEDAAALGFATGSVAEGALAAAAPLAISCWRGRGNLNVLVSKQECSQMAQQIKEAQAAAQKAAGAGAGAKVEETKGAKEEGAKQE